MQRVDIEDRLRVIIARLADAKPADVNFAATWRNLGIDSLDLFELLIACEQEFGIEIPDTAAVNFHCANDMIKFLAATPVKR